jgi:hypothetical protein
MAEKRKINAEDIVRDIRRGCTDKEIMTKYRLSAKGLQSALSKLIKLQVIDPDELEGRSQLFDDTINVLSMRRSVRVPAPYPIEIRDKNNLEYQGMVKDISEVGVGTRDIEANFNEKRTFLVTCDEFVDIDPIEFEAVCRWAKQAEDGSYFAGFEIVNISDENRTELRKLIHNISYMRI